MTNGPIETSAPIAASLAIALRRIDAAPAAPRHEERHRVRERGVRIVGCGARRSGGADASESCVPRITADARVAASCARYRGFATKVSRPAAPA